MLPSIFVHICLPIFLLIGAGWLLDRRFGIDMGSLVKLNLYLFVPAFLFVYLIETRVSGWEAMRVCTFTLGVILSMMAIAALVARVCRWEVAHCRALQLATMFYNSGNFGIPLMLLAFPENGPRIQVFVLATMNLATFTLGVLLASDHGPRHWRRFLPLLRQVCIWAIAVALVVRGMNWPLAKVGFLWVPLTYLKNGLIPVALVTLGVQLSQTRHSARLAGRIGAALVIRLAVGPLVAWGLALACGFRGEPVSILILSSGVPTAVNTALLAHEFKADAEFAAAAVFYSTLASAVTITVLLGVLR